MNVTLSPDVAQFVDEQIRAGRFSSADALIEAALSEFRIMDETELDEDTVAAIQEGLDQADRGQGIDLDAFRAQFFKRTGAQ